MTCCNIILLFIITVYENDDKESLQTYYKLIINTLQTDYKHS